MLCVTGLLYNVALTEAMVFKTVYVASYDTDVRIRILVNSNELNIPKFSIISIFCIYVINS